MQAMRPNEPERKSPLPDPDNFDFDGLIKEPVVRKHRAHKEPEPDVTKTEKFKDDPRVPPDTGCEFYGCKRKKNLWPWDFDTKTIWLCWPHFKRYRDRPQPYKGRMKHNDFARGHLEGSDYPRPERDRHVDLARKYFGGRLQGRNWLK